MKPYNMNNDMNHTNKMIFVNRNDKMKFVDKTADSSGSTPEINEETALTVLIEELSRIGVYDSNTVVKTSLHVLAGRISALMSTIESARLSADTTFTILSQPK